MPVANNRKLQREWEKVWQNQTETMHLKSLDYMGIQVKSNDKRNLSAKHLVDVIKTKHEEQRRARIAGGKTPRYQFIYGFKDQGVLLDLLRFMTIHATVGGQHNAVERRRILEFFETFIPQFFDLSDHLVQEKLADIDQDSAEEEEDDPAPVELANGRPRRNGKKSDLLRGVLDPGRNGSRPRTQKEDSAASGSKETTPDVGSANEEEMPDAAEDAAVPEVSNDRWLPTVPLPTISREARNGKDELDNALLDGEGELKADAPFPRSWYNFYCNQNIFVFFSVFQALYKRLVEVKASTESVTEEIRRERAEKPAKILGLVHDELRYFDDENPETFWPRTVELIEDYINGEIDEARYQDVLRHYYLRNGWTLYTIQDLLKTLCRIGLACNNPDTKGEKTKELVKEYLASRQHDETSYQTEISARKFAEKCIKDGEMFVICWVSQTFLLYTLRHVSPS
jgi:paired amphipathic helix protein Sin3a